MSNTRLRGECVPARKSRDWERMEDAVLEGSYELRQTLDKLTASGCHLLTTLPADPHSEHSWGGTARCEHDR